MCLGGESLLLVGVCVRGASPYPLFNELLLIDRGRPVREKPVFQAEFLGPATHSNVLYAPRRGIYSQDSSPQLRRRAYVVNHVVSRAQEPEAQL